MTAVTRGHAPGLAARVAAVRERIAEAARAAGRQPEDVTLIAVSKTFGPEDIQHAISAGVLDFGENRVQEAEPKIPNVTAATGLRWHLIGHLQRNKVNKALDLFDVIHSIDSRSLAEAVGRRAERAQRRAPILLQLNVGDTPTQHGFAIEEVEHEAHTLAGQAGLAIEGLMCIAPLVDDAEATRPYFRRLAQLHARLAPAMRAAGHPWRHLSMGMTNDYPVAVQEGATLVRVGRAIFGERPPVAAEAR